jgi:hypothetical protein
VTRRESLCRLLVILAAGPHEVEGRPPNSAAMDAASPTGPDGKRRRAGQRGAAALAAASPVVGGDRTPHHAFYVRLTESHCLPYRHLRSVITQLSVLRCQSTVKRVARLLPNWRKSRACQRAAPAAAAAALHLNDCQNLMLCVLDYADALWEPGFCSALGTARRTMQTGYHSDIRSMRSMRCAAAAAVTVCANH